MDKKFSCAAFGAPECKFSTADVRQAQAHLQKAHKRQATEAEIMATMK